MDKERAFILAFSLLLRSLVDEQPKVKTTAPTTTARKQRGRPRKVRQPKYQTPDLGVEGFEPEQAFEFLGNEPRKPSPPPNVEDDRPKVPMGYSPSRETDEEGTQDSQPWLNGQFG